MKTKVKIISLRFSDSNLRSYPSKQLKEGDEGFIDGYTTEAGELGKSIFACVVLNNGIYAIPLNCLEVIS